MRRSVAMATSIFAQPASAATPRCGLGNGKAATGRPIPVGAVVTCSGIADFTSGSGAAAAYFRCVNANGGIHGRPIIYNVLDDQSQASIAEQAAKKLVIDDNVVALVGGASIIECLANAGLYERHDIYDILSTAPPSQCYFAKRIIPLSAGPRLTTIGVVRYAVEKLGVKSVACSRPRIPRTAGICDGVREWGRAHGVSVTEVVSDPSSTDMGSLVLRFLQTKADAVVSLGTYDVFVQLLHAAQEQNAAAQMKFLAPGSAYNAKLPSAIGPYWSGWFWTAIEFQPTDSTGPDNENWHAVMDVCGQKSDPRGNFSQGGYLAARLLTGTLLKMNPDHITPATVTAALGNIRNFRSDVVCGPIDFGGAAAKRHNPNHWGRVAVAEKDHWKIVSPCTASDDPEVKRLFSH
jgi:branched-chain amino acid transport system substrate-binding protein